MKTEHVLCVPRKTLFPDGRWEGLITTGLDRIVRTIRAVSEYRRRALVEEDESQQQIIPYCVVRHADGSYLLTQRLTASTEQRLHNLYSLGIGGHINPGDGRGCDPVEGGLRREWREEVICASPARARLIAMINDGSNAVSRVHLGLVFLVEPAAGVATVREHEKLAGERVSLNELCRRRPSMERWSQLAVDNLVAGESQPADASRLVIDLPAAP